MPVRLLLALTVLVGCASALPPCPAAPVGTPGPPFLWRVDVDKEGGPVVWLFGTIHDAGLDAVPRAARDALASSTRFASELGDNEPDDRDKLRELMRIKSGPGLDQLLPVDDWWDLRDALRDVIKDEVGCGASTSVFARRTRAATSRRWSACS